MMPKQAGQSVVETIFLTSLIAIGSLSLWATCQVKIIGFVDMILSVISSPVP